jgi:protein-tyrosine-phosphatase
VLFVCTRNAARSQLAAALWRERAGGRATSAGSAPAPAPDPLAAAVATRHGLDPSTWAVRGYADVDDDPDLVVSVCDRARELGVPWSATHLHWSVLDPHGGDEHTYERAFADVAARVERLAAAVA